MIFIFLIDSYIISLIDETFNLVSWRIMIFKKHMFVCSLSAVNRTFFYYCSSFFYLWLQCIFLVFRNKSFAKNEASNQLIAACEIDRNNKFSIKVSLHSQLKCLDVVYLRFKRADLRLSCHTCDSRCKKRSLVKTTKYLMPDNNILTVIQGSLNSVPKHAFVQICIFPQTFQSQFPQTFQSHFPQCSFLVTFLFFATFVE